MKQDYLIHVENENLIMEVHKRQFARRIVDELIAERKRQGLTQQDIADRTGMRAPNITRIESCRYNPTLEVLERYAMAVGKKLHFELIDIE